jgi:ATP-dependent Clp protease protease subunit
MTLDCLTLLTCNVQPIGRFQGQATDVDIARKEIRNVKIEMVLSAPHRKKELITSAQILTNSALFKMFVFSSQ